ncbi:MAG: glucose-1-phosphate thymidylyltransferase [Candidatus Syntrophoarchaeum butanivorans]|uniref:Glucose-1-phosphate thymidylyltransferase n=1 Tax=Candidatus Syntropharchaeum butanivorans TaxID=1839936 RepID=A0A1F2P8Q0_9EURY|nr:MAG: glucose-1-phosphate thymidylyltransferase [Candidatus Syntrophoarchaeum butanivorans]
MKALILAGGRGRRLGNLTNSMNKCMIGLGGKPVIEYNLARAAEIEEIAEIVVVVGHRAEEIINRYGISYNGKRIQYVIQWEQKGLVHAIECAKDAIGKDDFFLLLGDEVLVNSRHKEMLEVFKQENLFGICGVVFQHDLTKISRTYTVIVDDAGRVFRLIEKPKKALNNFQGTGHCIFKNEILSYIERTPIHPERGEKELPDLIQCAVDDGQVVKIFDICDAYTNINSEEDLKEAEEVIKGNE